MVNAMNEIGLIIPCYNEQEVLLKTAKILKNKLETLMQKNKIILIMNINIIRLKIKFYIKRWIIMKKKTIISI